MITLNPGGASSRRRVARDGIAVPPRPARLFLPLALAALAASLLAACGGKEASNAAQAAVPIQSPSQAGIAWFQGTPEQAFAEARASNRPVMIYWGAEWCPYCESLKATVFSRPDFIAKSGKVIALYFDGDRPEAQAWGSQLKVVGYPTVKHVVAGGDRGKPWPQGSGTRLAGTRLPRD